MQILMLCHGIKHILRKEDTLIPVTPKSIRDITFLDKDEDCEPDILHDWRHPISDQLHNRWDIVTSVCADGDLFIRDGGLDGTCIRNVINVLKPGGFFIMEPLVISNIKLITNYLLANNVLNINLNILNTLNNNPFEIENYPMIKKKFTEYMATSIEFRYDKLQRVHDPEEFLHKLYSEYSFNQQSNSEEHFTIFQKKI